MGNGIEISIDPEAFSLGPITVHWYGVMVALAVAMLVTWIWYFTTRKGGATTDMVMAAALWAIPFGLIGARLIHVIDKFDYYLDNPREIVGFDGLAIFGVILGGLLGAWIYCRLRRIPFAPLADLAAPGILIAQAIGRAGCIINGCCGGKETSLPWAFIYTHPSSHAPFNVPIHPTHMYELLGDLLIFVLLFWVFRGRLRPHGSLLALYLVMYSALTFTVRFWRGDTEPFAGPVHEGQLIAALIFIVAAGWLVMNRVHWVKKSKDEDVGSMEAPVVEHHG
ncbi:MAG: prolipoprotein diacylglyceryl transferase [Dehalococcoidia bacterium]|nr:MAG: prolipoprotein diacylglyceryl transferase [Dehalococcoidia bacterium]